MKTSFGIWWKAWESTVRANWSRAIPGQGIAGRHRERQNCPDGCHFGSLETHGHKTDWVPLNKSPECPKCKPEVWNVLACPWTMSDYRGDCGILVGTHDYFGGRREESGFGYFMINMQYLATILEHLPWLCKWAPPLVKHCWTPCGCC